jgi:hypothetical protein
MISRIKKKRLRENEVLGYWTKLNVQLRNSYTVKLECELIKMFQYKSDCKGLTSLRKVNILL